MSVCVPAGLLLPDAASPTHHLRVPAVLTADDDGSDAATVTAAQIQTRVANANTVWAGARPAFDFDPATDIELRNSSLLGNDCTPVAPDSRLSGPNKDERERIALDDEQDGRITVCFRTRGRLRRGQERRPRRVRQRPSSAGTRRTRRPIQPPAERPMHSHLRLKRPLGALTRHTKTHMYPQGSDDSTPHPGRAGAHRPARLARTRSTKGLPCRPPPCFARSRSSR